MIRFLTAIIAVVISALTVVILNFALSDGSSAARFLINKSGDEMVWFSEQAFMWLFFYLGVGELTLRLLASGRERRQNKRGFLPEDDSVILTEKELPEVYSRAKRYRESYLPRLIMRVVRQFQISKSADQANGVLDSSLELFLHEIDLKYNMLRYIMWVIPTIGFIGTVRGIALGLSTAAAESHAGRTEDLLYVVSNDLGVAFYTTLLALLMSGVLVLIMHICQGREEGALNQSGQYCIDHLINKLYNPN